MNVISQAQAQSGKTFDKPAQAALWLSILLTKLVSVLTVFPLYALARRFYTDETSRVIAGIWLLIPATLIFMPKSDAMFPFFAVLLHWLWMKCMERNSPVYGIITALVFVLALSLSLAFATIGVVLLMQLLYHAKRIRTGFWPTASGVITGLFILVTLYFVFGMNLIAIWLQNFQNHGAFYEHNSRTYVAWLLANPIELAMALGMPLAICSTIGGLIMARHYQERDYFDVVAVLIVWITLYITGKNMGEAARLWIFLMPYAVLMAGPVLERMTKSATQFRRPAFWLSMLLLQAIACLSTAIRIDGFGFTEL